MNKAWKHIAYFLLLIVLMLPGIQMITGFWEEKKLEGAFVLAEKPSFDKKKWMNGSFQAEMEGYLKDHSGFHAFFVRLQNQVDYTCFRQANAEGAIIGKNKQLFEYDYIRSWLAIDYPGDDFIRTKLLRTKWVQDYLKNEKGIDFMVVFEPGKASFYPEYLPERYQRLKQGPSTYDRYRKQAEELGVEFIDLHAYFLNLKANTEFPLFPEYGTHWSVYGMHHAADSLLQFISHRKNRTLTRMSVERLETSTLPRDTDDDVLKTMNLLFRPSGQVLAYPVYTFDTLQPGYRPMVLTVADSYYWNIFNSGIPRYVFANQAFWYFNALVYPDHYFKPSYTKDLNLQQEVEKQEVIFLMVTERFLHKFDWGFVDQLFNLYAPGWLHDPVYEKINSIMHVETWFDNIIAHAAKQGVSLPESLADEAKYLYHQEDPEGYLIDYGMEHYQSIIREDSAWYAFILEKAKAENVSNETMLERNAAYVFSQEHPALFEIHTGMKKYMLQLSADPAIYEQLKREAADNHWPEDRYLRKKAWEQFRADEIDKTRKAVLADQAWLGEVSRKARSKAITVDEMIRLDALYLFNQKYGQFSL